MFSVPIRAGLVSAKNQISAGPPWPTAMFVPGRVKKLRRVRDHGPRVLDVAVDVVGGLVGGVGGGVAEVVGTGLQDGKRVARRGVSLS
jgi:hypothetical protein